MLRRLIGLRLLPVLLGACAAPAPLLARVTPNPVMLGPVQYYQAPRTAVPQPLAEHDAKNAPPNALTRGAFVFSTLLSSQTNSEGEESVTETWSTAQGSFDAALIAAVAGSARGRVLLTDIRCTSWVFFTFIYLATQQGCEASGTAEFPQGLQRTQHGAEDAPARALLPSR